MATSKMGPGSLKLVTMAITHRKPQEQLFQMNTFNKNNIHKELMQNIRRKF